MKYFILLLVLHLCSFSNGSVKYQYTRFTKVTLAVPAPDIHTIYRRIPDPIRCALKCRQARGVPCTGFNFRSQVCRLLKGAILTQTTVIQEHETHETEDYSKPAFYRKETLPKCEEYPHFELITTGKESYCLFFSKKQNNYNDARLECRQYGSHLTFFDTPSKLLLVQQGISRATDEQDIFFWNGAYQKGGTNVFVAKFMDQSKSLQPSNELWSEGEPSAPNQQCVLGRMDGKLYDEACDEKPYYSCEVFEFSDKA